MTRRENILRAARFQKPEWIPIAVGIGPILWKNYDTAEVEDIMSSHPILFPDFHKGDVDPASMELRPDIIAAKPYTDAWGCVWKTNFDGMVGAVVKHPLADWAAFEGYSPPDPDRTDGMFDRDWEALRKDVERARMEQKLVIFYLPHGHSFLRIQDLRGYENLIFDMMDDEPRLWDLITMVESFNLELARRYLALEPDIFGIPEDLGMQNSPMISPELFRKYIKPSYRKLTAPFKEKGILVHEHSDGYILDLMDDIIDAGGDIINLQDLVNGLDNIRRAVKGRLAIDLDIDRQNVTVHGSPGDIEDHIREAVIKLGGPEGGLSLTYQPWPPTPAENIRAVCRAMEKYCRYYG